MAEKVLEQNNLDEQSIELTAEQPIMPEYVFNRGDFPRCSSPIPNTDTSTLDKYFEYANFGYFEDLCKTPIDSPTSDSSSDTKGLCLEKKNDSDMQVDDLLSMCPTSISLLFGESPQTGNNDRCIDNPRLTVSLPETLCGDNMILAPTCILRNGVDLYDSFYDGDVSSEG